jgi:hypothetical protein
MSLTISVQTPSASDVTYLASQVHRARRSVVERAGIVVGSLSRRLEQSHFVSLRIQSMLQFDIGDIADSTLPNGDITSSEPSPIVDPAALVDPDEEAAAFRLTLQFTSPQSLERAAGEVTAWIDRALAAAQRAWTGDIITRMELEKDKIGSRSMRPLDVVLVLAHVSKLVATTSHVGNTVALGKGVRVTSTF